MFRDREELTLQISSIHETMTTARTLKTAALLRNLIYLQAVTPNVTRCSGQSHMLPRYSRIRDELIQASGDDDGSLPINCSVQFASKVKKTAARLSEINETTVNLQTRCYTLEKCRGGIDSLLQNITEAEPNVLHFLCSVRDSYIKMDNSL